MGVWICTGKQSQKIQALLDPDGVYVRRGDGRHLADCVSQCLPRVRDGYRSPFLQFPQWMEEDDTVPGPVTGDDAVRILTAQRKRRLPQNGSASVQILGSRSQIYRRLDPDVRN